MVLNGAGYSRAVLFCAVTIERAALAQEGFSFSDEIASIAGRRQRLVKVNGR
jgi:hypothetical protein